MRRLPLCLALAVSACGSSTVRLSDAGTPNDAGPRDAGASGGGAAQGGGTAGGQSAGGAGGGTAGGSTAGGTSGGGAAGGGVAGGSAGGGAADAGAIALNGADTCSGSAPDVTAGGTFLGSTFLATDDYSVSGMGCPSGGAASGRDVAYLLAPSVTRAYRVRVTPLERPLGDGGVIRFDPMLYVQPVCGAGLCVAGTIFNGVGEPEEVTFTVNAGQTVYVVVDGELASRGDFELDVSF